MGALRGVGLSRMERFSCAGTAWMARLHKTATATGGVVGILTKLFRPGVAGQASTAFVPRQESWHAPAPVVSPTWLQPYTFRAGGHVFDVVGESHYQPALEAAAGGRTSEGAACPLVTALLVREPRNPFDARAIRVDVGGQTVGYIPRDWTGAFHPVLAELHRLGTVATCRAWLTGGWDRGGLDRGHFGIRLDLHDQLHVVSNAVLMPFGNGRVSVTGEEKYQTQLAVILGASNRVEVIVALTHGNDRIAVVLGEQLVGELTGKMSMRFAPWINELEHAGLPATAEARVIRGEKKIEVFLKLAKPWFD
jgi:hypothetical protein